MVDLQKSPDERGPTGLHRSETPTLLFEEMFRQEFPAMVALAAVITGDRSVAEDVAQEAMIRAQRDWRRISNYELPGAWLRRVTINLACSQRRQRHANGRRQRRLEAIVQVEAAPPRDSDPELWRAVALLPPKQRAAVALYYLEDRPVSEIAELLDCDKSTARVHLHRGRTAIARVLEESHG